MKERVLCRLYKNEDGGDTMDKDNVSIFKLACERYLNTLGLGNLRSYGRFLQLKEPTKRNKAELIQEIIGVLCGEIIAKRTKRGAPIKNTYVEPQILQTVQASASRRRVNSRSSILRLRTKAKQPLLPRQASLRIPQISARLKLPTKLTL